MYQALYRQYRPKTFEELLGQDHVTVTLKNQIDRGNIGHAYLFSGTRGTGKTSAAKIFSRAVNCLNPVNGNPCNECENCREIINESTMDVIEMDAASNNSVDDIRELRDKVIYPPSKLKYKVYIIDEVHMLSKGAFNALLKTLEEPPKHLIFILATTEPERLPPTILSRCQRFDFRRIVNLDIIKNMRSITEDLGIEVEDEALKLIARNADGAMRDALSLLDQCISYEGNNISYEDAISILGVTNIDLIFNLVDDIGRRDMEKTLEAINGIIQDGKDIHQFVKDLMIHFRNLMIVKSTKNLDRLEDMDNLDRYIDQSKNIELEFILKALEILTEADNKIKWTSQPRIILEMSIIQIVKIVDDMSLEERVELLEGGERPVINRPVKEPENIPVRREPASKQVEKRPVEKKIETAPTNISEGTDLDFDVVKKEWPNILDQIKDVKVNISALLRDGDLISFENDLITVSYDEAYEFHRDAVSSGKNIEFVEDIISKYFNRDIRINYVMSKKKIDDNEEKDQDKSDKEEAIREAIDFFGDDLVKIK